MSFDYNGSVMNWKLFTGYDCGPQSVGGCICVCVGEQVRARALTKTDNYIKKIICVHVIAYHISGGQNSDNIVHWRIRNKTCSATAATRRTWRRNFKYISHRPSQWERAIFDPHSFETPRLIFMKIENIYFISQTVFSQCIVPHTTVCKHA